MPKRLAIKLSSAGEKSVRQGHPWVFSNAIEKNSENPQSGDLAVVFGKAKNKVIGLGLYDSDSPIRIKMLYSGNERVIIDDSFFKKGIEIAFQLRLPLLKTNTNSYRLLFGENDGFPGLIVDIYNEVAVLKLYSKIWLPYLEGIKLSIIEITKVKTMVIRLSRSLQNYALDIKDGMIVYGELIDEEVAFIEYGMHFVANVIKGHKTGFFLDHRENRKQVGLISKGKTVLDVFSYAGGFSVHALSNGALEVTSLDISEKALEVARRNVNSNQFLGSHFTICGDAFIELQQLIDQKKIFDVVVIDPPSFAKRKSEIDKAKKKYKQLAEFGVKLTAPNGILVLASCSSRITSQSFFDINNQVLRYSNRRFSLINKTAHDIDHPITFPEAAYLKTGYYRFNDS